MELPVVPSSSSSSRPYGTFRVSNLYPGLPPGLSSAVPAGLSSESPGSREDTLTPEVRFWAVRVRTKPPLFYQPLWRLRRNFHPAPDPVYFQK
jgi:hypothetical protein